MSNGNTSRELFQLRSVQSIGTLPFFEVFYRSIFDLDRDFMKDEVFSQQDRTVGKYLKPDLVIIDDRGLEYPGEIAPSGRRFKVKASPAGM